MGSEALGSGTQVRLTITAYGESTTDQELEMYKQSVKFMAYWFTKQNGAMGSDTPALFDEYKNNICLAMAAGTKGSG